jgi:ParB/RepB/Spo0J family partition protein
MKFDPKHAWAGLVPVTAITPNPNQPRTYFDPESLKSLGTSMMKKQRVPVIVVPHKDKGNPDVQWMLVDGERRWSAACAAGMTEIKASYDPDIVLADLHEHSFVANWCREGHTYEETVKAVGKLMQQGQSLEMIGKAVGKSTSWADNMRALDGLHPKLLKAMSAPTLMQDRLGLRPALLLCKLKPFDQLTQWDRLREMSRDEQVASLRRIEGVSKTVGIHNACQTRTAKALVERAVASLHLLTTMPVDDLRKMKPADQDAVSLTLARFAGLAAEAMARMKLAMDSKAEDEGRAAK